ncbi:hypothetical protein [Bacillus badius]|uniref:Uncharacterized protein n=1 Tax=Bacillus badius TaxID=1455 RepID=A0ABR5AX37_BACBA|nr:hypothetical protein [Bacillus badius]KIL76112.1 hypothetical protein SD78_0214 [Bacillus badius]KIL79324.1 hypothetical protein SD77_3190 [Bacillus badius]KZO00317.1 hypothetical protein A4244_05375 [Bacillus badius]KZR59734.1 hypothetical protein A3781_11800 [Bacillus badius]MED0668366.1 hypothetical protein [Bacillus badius]
MKKKTMSYVMSGALSIGILGSAPSMTAAGPATTKAEMTSYKYKEGQQIKPIKDFSDVMREQAEALGIHSENKDIETLAKEVREAKVQQQAAAFGIDTANKDFHTLKQEIRKAQQSLNEKR